MIRVYHCEHFVELAMAGAKMSDQELRETWVNLAGLVAKVWTDDLDEAYQRTNSFDEPWTNARKPGYLVCADGNLRSTTAGDFMMIWSDDPKVGDHLYLVDLIGFRDLGKVRCRALEVIMDQIIRKLVIQAERVA